MGVFSVPVTIGIDEDRIAKEIEANVESQVIKAITERVESIICQRTWGDRYNKNNLSPLKEIVNDVIEKTIKEHEEYIIQSAISALANKLSRKKITKDMLEYELIKFAKE